MQIQQSIYEALQSNYGFLREVFIDDVVHNSCGYYHYLTLSGREPGKIQSGQKVFLERYALGLKATIRSYLKGCFGDRFQYVPTRTIRNTVTLSFDGMLDGFLVDVVPVSTHLFQNGVPKSVKVIESTKAGLVGAESIIVILVDRNGLQWSAWNISGCLDQPANVFDKEIAYIEQLMKEEAQPIGMASHAQCGQCQFSDTCEVERAPPPSLPVFSCLVMEDKQLLRDLDAYLWSLNDRSSGRTKKVIHPSEFSTSPCDRRIAYGLVGEREERKVDPQLRRIFDAGHVVHDIVQASLIESHEDFHDEVVAENQSLRIRGHCDGVLSNVGFEIKSISCKAFPKLRSAKSEHKKQATLYCGCLDLDHVLYMYVNKETGDIAVFEAPMDRKLWHKQATRAGRIVKNVDSGELPPRIQDKDYLCRKCPYVWKCRPDMNKRSFR